MGKMTQEKAVGPSRAVKVCQVCSEKMHRESRVREYVM